MDRAVPVEVTIPASDARLPGDLVLPPSPHATVVFAHGSGSSRTSERNRYVAGVLNDAGFATLLFDLLTENEAWSDAETGELRFDIVFLARRLVAAIEWVARHPRIGARPIVLFGASTGAAAALTAAADRPGLVSAVVSRGGRPDLLEDETLARITAPTLLIVGGRDIPVLELNRAVLDRLGSHDRTLEIVPGAGHLFEQPGSLERVAVLARDWFATHTAAPVPA